MKSIERLCTLCKENYVEDEIHFVCVCKIYDLHRKKLYDYIKEQHEMFKHLSDENKFIILLKYESRKLAEYLFEAWNLRNSILFKC